MKPSRLLVGVLALAFLLPGSAGAHGDTYLHEAFTNGITEITPGICAPGDTATCVGPEVAQFRAGLNTNGTCRLNGTFEGVTYNDVECSFDFYGFLVGVAPGTKPVCGAAFFYLSDETTAFGPNKVNTFTFGDVTRRIYIEGYSFGTILVFTKVAVDDDDADTDPAGDHTAVAAPTPILRDAASGAGASCVQAPLTRGLMVSGTSIFM